MNIQEEVVRALNDIAYDHFDTSVVLILTAFLDAAAKQGWTMRPDEATEEMQIADCELDCGYAVCHKAVGGPRCVNHGERLKYSDESWAAMSAAAPKFELDKSQRTKGEI